MKRIVIGTYLKDDQRHVIEASADEVFDIVHRDSVRELVNDAALGHVSAILVSAERMEAPDIRAISLLRAELPSNEVIGVSTEGQLQGVLRLGRAGVARLIDLRSHAGPGLLRSAFATARDTFPEDAVRTLLDGVQVTPSFARFLGLAFRVRGTRAKVGPIAAEMGLTDRIMYNRFFRAGLPLKKFIAWARLAHAAHLGEQKTLSAAEIAYRLEIPHTQSFSRFVKQSTGMWPLEFFDRWNGDSWLAHMRSELIEPYVAQLRTFDPAAGSIINVARRTRGARLALVRDAA